MSTAASAANYYYCVVQDYGGNEVRYITDILETDVEKIDEGKTGFAFSEAIEAQWHRDYPAEASRRSYCSATPNLSYLKERYSDLLSENPAARRSSFPNSPVPSRRIESSGASGLIIKEGPKPKSAAELEAQQLKYKRQQAAEAAKLAAATAKSNAETQQKIDEAIAKLKKRGAAQ